MVGQGTSVTRNYTYDPIGNLTADYFRDLNGVVYTRASYPSHISKSDAEIDYLYNLGDLRMYKRTETLADTTEEYYLKASSGQDLGILDMTSNNWTWYVSGADRIAKVTPAAEQQPAAISLQGGLSNNQDYLFEEFYLYDHLGNTRVVYKPLTRDGNCLRTLEIVYAADYYPYGKILREFSIGEVEKFLTTQHERDLETGLDYRGARFYDSDVARFLSLDPLAADYLSWSAYSYVMGNPVMIIDPTGAAAEDTGPIAFNYTASTTTVTYYVGASSKFNQLDEHTKNFLMQKWQMMDDDIIYKRLLGEAIYQGSDAYDQWIGDPDFWTSNAQSNWNAGWNNWDKRGAGNGMMNIAATGIGTALVAGAGGSIFEGVLGTGAGQLSITTGYSSMVGTGNLLHYTVSSAASTELGYLSSFWVGRQLITGASLYTGMSLWSMRTGGPSQVYGFAHHRKQWFRFNTTYSQSGGYPTVGLKWGASPHFNKMTYSDYPNLMFLNSAFRNTKLPGSGWRTADPGHFHLKKK